MLTRLKVQGFKSLLDVEVFFGPFTCFIGPNAAGKSNIFDAIRFLSLLAEYPIADAAARIREAGGKSADPEKLFTLFGSFVAPEIRLEADIIVERGVEDDFGVRAEATRSPLRYVVTLRLDKTEKPYRIQLVEEKLFGIGQRESVESMKFALPKALKNSGCMYGQRSAMGYISTYDKAGDTLLGLHQDGRHGRRLNFPARNARRTMLQSVNTSEYPTALAVKREMLSWRTLMLEPSAMRTPSSYRDPDQVDARGANLPAAIHRLQHEEACQGQVCAELTNRIAELIEDIRDMRIIDDPVTETYTLEAKDSSGVYHAARALSDGTLRFLAMAVLSVDPLAKGVLCLEEPENGIHPGRVAPMVNLLRDIAVDFSETIDLDNPLRQIVLNSHSSDVLAVCKPGDLVYVSAIERSQNGSFGQVTTLYVPPGSWRKNRPKQLVLVLGQLRPYIREDLPSAMEQLWLDLPDRP